MRQSGSGRWVVGCFSEAKQAVLLARSRPCRTSAHRDWDWDWDVDYGLSDGKLEWESSTLSTSSLARTIPANIDSSWQQLLGKYGLISWYHGLIQ